MKSTASLARDLEIARGYYPEEMETLDNLRERLRTNFKDTFLYLCEAQHLLRLPAAGEYLLVHQLGLSNVALHVSCDETTEEAVELALIHPALRAFVEVIYDQQKQAPSSRCSCQHESHGQTRPRYTAGAIDAKDESGTAPTSPARTHDDSMFWGFGYDHAAHR